MASVPTETSSLLQKSPEQTQRRDYGTAIIAVAVLACLAASISLMVKHLGGDPHPTDFNTCKNDGTQPTFDVYTRGGVRKALTEANLPGVTVVGVGNLPNLQADGVAGTKVLVVIDDPFWSTDRSVYMSDIQRMLDAGVQQVFAGDIWEKDGIPKNVHGLPIGISTTSLCWYEGQFAEAVEQMTPFAEKPVVALASWNDRANHDPSWSGEHNNRAEVRDILTNNAGKGVVFPTERLSQEDFWKRHNNCAFEISPWGNGLDTHRTWEALWLQTVPIVQAGHLEFVYEGLPIVVVQDWHEVTSENLQAWFEKYKDTDWNVVKQLISVTHFVDQIKHAAEQ